MTPFYSGGLELDHLCTSDYYIYGSQVVAYYITIFDHSQKTSSNTWHLVW